MQEGFALNTGVVEKVNQIIHEKFEVPVEKLKPEAHLKNDLNLDSLDFIDMIVLLEQNGNFNLDNVDFTKISSLNDVYDMVEKISSQTTH